MNAFLRETPYALRRRIAGPLVAGLALWPLAASAENEPAVTPLPPEFESQLETLLGSEAQRKPAAPQVKARQPAPAAAVPANTDPELSKAPRPGGNADDALSVSTVGRALPPLPQARIAEPALTPPGSATTAKDEPKPLERQIAAAPNPPITPSNRANQPPTAEPDDITASIGAPRSDQIVVRPSAAPTVPPPLPLARVAPRRAPDPDGPRVIEAPRDTYAGVLPDEPALDEADPEAYYRGPGSDWDEEVVRPRFGGYGNRVSVRRVFFRLNRSGFRAVRFVRDRGDVFVFRARDFSGARVRLWVDAYSGEIVDLRVARR